MTFDRETIGAYVDGELDEIRRRRFEAALQVDPALARRVESERRLRGALQARFAPIMEEPLPEKLVAKVRDGARLGAVVPLPHRRWIPAAIAASIAALAVMGLQLRPSSDPNLASGALARALETQLASAQAADAPVRIGFTFKAKGGTWCRTFEQGVVSGIACRSGQGWRLRYLERDKVEGGEYRQAGSPAVAGAAQSMSIEPPLDADQERAALRLGWKL